jgi:hypothetical protein
MTLQIPVKGFPMSAAKGLSQMTTACRAQMPAPASQVQKTTLTQWEGRIFLDILTGFGLFCFRNL